MPLANLLAEHGIAQAPVTDHHGDSAQQDATQAKRDHHDVPSRAGVPKEGEVQTMEAMIKPSRNAPRAHGARGDGSAPWVDI